MPYIKKEDRKEIQDWLNQITSSFLSSEGKLNFIISLLCLKYLKQHGERYSTYNTLLGVLEGVKQELYRRKISGYEDRKIQENGDIF